MALGFCQGCNEEKEIVLLVCADCLSAAKNIVTPKVEAALTEARNHPAAAKVIEVLEDWATGYRARKQKGESKP